MCVVMLDRIYILLSTFPGHQTYQQVKKLNHSSQESNTNTITDTIKNIISDQKVIWAIDTFRTKHQQGLLGFIQSAYSHFHRAWYRLSPLYSNCAYWEVLCPKFRIKQSLFLSRNLANKTIMIQNLSAP